MDSIKTDTVFRTREATQEPETAPQEAKGPEVTDSGNLDKAITPNPEFSPASELEKWEIKNGKYGLDYLGIKEITKEFPYKAQFGILDKYIKGEIKERGYDATPENYQKLLNEIETEIKTSGLNAIERLKRLSSYIRILGDIKRKKSLKEQYLNSTI